MIQIKGIIGSSSPGVIRGFIPLQTESDIKNNEPLKLIKEKNVLKTFKELSKNEEIEIYYESNDEKKKYDTLRLFYKFYFYEAFEKLDTGVDFMHFIHTDNNKQLALKTYKLLLNGIVAFFTDKYGDPEIETSDKEPFKVTKYTWLFSMNEIDLVLIMRDSLDETEKFNMKDYAQLLNIIVASV